jgi:acetyl-CoA decarbonylase/synthase complex subunit gamma
MAFAMKLAAKKAMLSECPYASDEAKEVLGAASEPPVKGVKIGNEIVAALGEETVMYRHEKTFVNQPVIAVNLDEGADMALAEAIGTYRPVRVGEELNVGAIAITQKGDGFADYCKQVYEKTKLPLILKGKDIASLDKASAAVAGSKSVICGVTADMADEAVKIAQRDSQVLAVTAPDVDGIFALTSKLKEGGFNDLIIEFQTHSLSETFQTNSVCRKAALKASVKALGYASLCFINTGDEMDDTVAAVTQIDKFGGIIVLPTFDKAQIVTLMSLRQNIYTDPQKPIMMEAKIYHIGEPDRNSHVFVTTNFSLTYFLVSGEIENSGISAYLICPECEGFSVLTAWSAGKFSGAIIAKFMKEMDFEGQIDTRAITIPGYVAQISGELEENLPGYKIMVGPQEASDIESYVKNVLLKK